MSRKGEIAKNILTVLGAVGLVVICLAIPNAAQVFVQFQKRSKNYSKKQYQRSLGYLKDNGLVIMKKDGDNTLITLTKNGRKKLLSYKLDDLTVKKLSNWDKKWRLVIFDIPEKFKVSRVTFAKKLKEMGFKNFQKSVWVYPFPCEDEIDFLKEIYNIRPFVRIVTAESIDIQHDLLKTFNLK